MRILVSTESDVLQRAAVAAVDGRPLRVQLAAAVRVLAAAAGRRIDAAHEAAVVPELGSIGGDLLQDEGIVARAAGIVADDLPQVIAADYQPLEPMVLLRREDADERRRRRVLGDALSPVRLANALDPEPRQLVGRFVEVLLHERGALGMYLELEVERVLAVRARAVAYVGQRRVSLERLVAVHAVGRHGASFR